MTITLYAPSAQTCPACGAITGGEFCDVSCMRRYHGIANDALPEPRRWDICPYCKRETRRGYCDCAYDGPDGSGTGGLRSVPRVVAPKPTPAVGEAPAERPASVARRRVPRGEGGGKVEVPGEELTYEQRRGRRKRAVRPVTIDISRLSKVALDRGHVPYPVDVQRPRTRGDCASVERPCPFVSCKWHLYLDVHSQTGNIKLNFPDLEPDEMAESCALDVAERGGANLELVAGFANLTREAVRQIEVKAKRRLMVLRDHLDDERSAYP